MWSADGESDELPVHRVSVRAFCLDRTEASGPDGLPITHVTWDEAAAACRRQGARLPTEAEWEFAARGTEGRRYPWGGAPPNCARANSFECGRQMRPSGSLPGGATPEGVHDLAGNVWEWVEDGYSDDYDGRPHPTRHVVRGGSFSRDVKMLRPTDRNWNPAGHRGPGLGYRCARAPLR